MSGDHFQKQRKVARENELFALTFFFPTKVKTYNMSLWEIPRTFYLDKNDIFKKEKVAREN